MMVVAAGLAAQSPRETWSVDGVVQRGQRSGPVAVPNQWVVVHRIASDAQGNVSGGPLDSTRTDSRGRFRIRYAHSGEQATYIAITTYSGVSYITSPLTRQNVSGDDATIMVFDTVAPPYPIHVAGRHLVIAAPDSGARRRVVEVYELLNDSTHTVIGSESNPVWRAPLPAGATDVQVNPAGDMSPAMTKVAGEWLNVFSPISPGLRQVSFTYTLPSDAFPLVMPVVDSTTVFELLVQEPEAAVEGGGFTEVAPVAQEGIPFRRFLAQNVPARAMIRFTMPKPVSSIGSRVVSIVVGSVSVLMLAVLALLFWKRRRPRVATAAPPAAVPNEVETLIRDLANLDVEFERRTNPSDLERAEFDAQRVALKARLNAALAAGTRPA
jgi:hypothetical protein